MSASFATAVAAETGSHRTRRWLAVSGQVTGALLLAPLALLVLVPLMALGGLVRAIGLGLTDLEVLPRRRTLEIDAEGAALAWSGSEGETEAALADAVDLLFEAARRSGVVRRVEDLALVAAPEEPARAVDRAGGGFGAALAAELDGRRIAYGSLLLNGGALRLALETDARSDRSGRLAVELPPDRWLAWTRVLVDLAPAWGFKVRTPGLQLPAPPADDAAA